MNMGLIVLLMVGIILMTANTAKTKIENKVTSGEKVVYKYLPLDMDAFYRQESISKPSKIYYSIFTQEDVKR